MIKGIRISDPPYAPDPSAWARSCGAVVPFGLPVRLPTRRHPSEDSYLLPTSSRPVLTVSTLLRGLSCGLCRNRFRFVLDSDVFAHDRRSGLRDWTVLGRGVLRGHDACQNHPLEGHFPDFL